MFILSSLLSIYAEVPHKPRKPAVYLRFSPGMFGEGGLFYLFWVGGEFFREIEMINMLSCGVFWGGLQPRG